VFSTVLLAGLALAGPPVQQPATTAQAFKLDHFQCYGAERSDFKRRSVKLRDQFGRSRARVIRRTTLCNPVSKNGEEIRDPRAHEVCYTIKRATRFKRRRVVVRHQFTDGLRLLVVRPVRLCLPSAKSERDPRPQDIPKLDHYQCYTVRPLDRFPPRDVRLKDQFDGISALVGPPVQLCNPVSKNGGRVRNKRDHLVCHRLTTDAGFDPRDVFITNQFEAGSPLKAIRRETLCFPALKRLLKPDLTPTIVGGPVPVSCPGGQGTCTTTVQFRVDNIGNTAAGPFDVLVRADPGLATTTTTSVAGLAAGASTGVLTVTLGPANNCYDPNCTVSVRADPGNAVDESDEGNNSAAVEFLG
jgi:hypothetical protein